MTQATAGWQRLSPWAILPLGLRLLSRVLREYLPALVGVGAGMAFIGGLGLRELGLLALFLLLSGLLYTLIWHRRFRFRIEADGIRVRQGILQRRELRVSWHRVRNMDIRQAFFLRPLGLVGVVLETVGGEGEEVSLAAVPMALAETLKARLSGRGDDDAALTGAETPEAVSSKDETLHQPAMGALFRHGLASGQLWLFFAALGGLYGSFHRQITPHLETGFVRLSGGLELGDGPGVVWLAASVLVAVAALLVLISGLMALVRFHAFSLYWDGKRLRARHGLLESRERSLDHDKLQAVTLVQSLVGRWLNCCHLLGHQASSGWTGDTETADGTVIVPALTPAEARRILVRLDERHARQPVWRGIDESFCHFWRVRLGLLLVAGAALGAGLGPGPLTAVLIMLALLLLPLLIVSLVKRRWSAWGWSLEGDILHLKSGLWGYRWELFNIRRVQQLRLQQNPYQRRAGVANLELYLADGPRTLPFLPEEEAVALANRVIHELERAPIHSL